MLCWCPRGPRSELAGEKQAGLLAGTLGLDDQSTCTAQLVSATKLARLPKARLYMGAG
jgi:hypothetical protein